MVNESESSEVVLSLGLVTILVHGLQQGFKRPLASRVTEPSHDPPPSLGASTEPIVVEEGDVLELDLSVGGGPFRDSVLLVFRFHACIIPHGSGYSKEKLKKDLAGGHRPNS